MHFLVAHERKQEIMPFNILQQVNKQEPTDTYTVSGTAVATGLGATIAGDLVNKAYTSKVLGINNQNLNRERSQSQFRKQLKRTEQLLNTRGFHKDKFFYNQFNNPQTGTNLVLDTEVSNMRKFGGPHITNTDYFGRRAVRLGANELGSTRTLAHELGHGLQSSRRLAVGRIGKNIGLAGTALAFGAGIRRSQSPEQQKSLDNIAKAGAGLGTLGFLGDVAVETDASNKGYKMMRDAGMLKRTKGVPRTLSRRLGAFHGVPTYALAAATPMLAYYGTRYLPDKLNGLYTSLKQRNTRPDTKQG